MPDDVDLYKEMLSSILRSLSSALSTVVTTDRYSNKVHL